MLIELHLLTSHAPANLNRDDLGRPKSAFFGGTNRARISSQAQKRAIRTSRFLEDQLSNRIGTRSRKIPEMIANELIRANSLDALTIDRVNEITGQLTSILGKADSKNPLHTKQIVFLSPEEIKKASEFILKTAQNDRKTTASELKKIKDDMVAEIDLGQNPGDAVDLALFGRMTTSDNKEGFASVDAALQVAHPISTHTVVSEVDWFTAVDDITTGKDEHGSAHLDETAFNSAVFYKYFSCNLELLIANMRGDAQDAIRSLALVFDAACKVTPSGKQNSFASHSLADTALLIIRREKIPISLVNAFERPIRFNNGFLSPSRVELAQHYSNIRQAYGLEDYAICFALGQDSMKDLDPLNELGVTMTRKLADMWDFLQLHALGAPAI